MANLFQPADSGTMPGGTPQSLASRRRVAEALLKSGFDISPVGHWTQGLARISQALAGGYLAGDADREDRANAASMSGVVQALLGGDTAAPAAGGSTAAPPTGMTRVASPSGAPATVAAPHAGQFGNLLKSLEEAGITIDPSQTGGYANRNIAGTNVPSQHASGRAIDINWRDNPQGRMDPMADMIDFEAGRPVAPGVPEPEVRRIPSYVARQAAQDAGMTWGGDFKNAPGGPDPMHFEVPRGPMPRNPSMVQYAQAGGRAAAPAAPPAGGLNLSPQTRAAIAALARTNPQAALGMILPMITKADQPTEQQRNYAAYVRDEIARGNEAPLSFHNWNLETRRAGATAITNDMRGERAFESEAGKRMATQYTEMVQAGREARNHAAMLGVLAELGPQIGTGLGAQLMQRIGPIAEALGVNVANLGEMQAYQAIANQLAPKMRVAGSGATSDFEMRQYLAALPQLRNTPGGNELITRTNQAIAQSQVAAAEIASRALAGEITHRDAERMLREIPNPLEQFIAARKKTRTPAQPAAPANGAQTRRYNPATGMLE